MTTPQQYGMMCNQSQASPSPALAPNDASSSSSSLGNCDLEVASSERGIGLSTAWPLLLRTNTMQNVIIPSRNLSSLLFLKVNKYLTVTLSKHGRWQFCQSPSIQPWHGIKKANGLYAAAGNARYFPTNNVIDGTDLQAREYLTSMLYLVWPWYI